MVAASRTCRVGTLVCFALLFSVVGCGRDAAAPSPQLLSRELGSLPSNLRDRFESGPGRAELNLALEGRELLAREAKRRKIHRRPEIVGEVEALETRLIIKALLEEEAGGEPTDAELRAWFEQHRSEFGGERGPRDPAEFAAVKGEVANRYRAAHSRESFDRLLTRLRREAAGQ